MSVTISTPVYRKDGIYWKDAACTQQFTDQGAAKVLWRQKQVHRFGAAGETVVALAKLAFLVFAVACGIALWDYSYQQGWRSHDELTTVASKIWTTGEYKQCTSLNFKDAKVLMTCDSVFGVEGKVFKVRFYGQTHFPGNPESFETNWQCRKNGDSEPTITCEMPAKQ